MASVRSWLEQHVFPLQVMLRRPNGRPRTHMFVCTPTSITFLMPCASSRFQISNPLSLIASRSALMSIRSTCLCHGASRVAPNVGKVLGPGGVFHRVVVFASVGVVDGVALFFLHLVDPVTPVFNRLREIGRVRCVDGSLTRGVILVESWYRMRVRG